MSSRLLYPLLVVCFALFVQPAAAQERTGGAADATVTGIVVQAESGEPVLTATAALYSAADSSLVTGAVTDEGGVFEITGVAPGQYYVRISFVGYAAKVVPGVDVMQAEAQVELGEITLAQDARQLEAVDVVAERSYREVEVDRTVYRPHRQPVTAGGSAMDALEVIPSVQVDIDGTISLRGSADVTIYLNGRPAPMTGQALVSFLSSLSAGAIERVEVIPTPSASFEPEGTSGIINIVLARDRGESFGGGVSAALSTNDEYRGSANAHYGTGPWTFFANYGLRYGGRDSDGSQFRENRFAEPITYLDQDMSGWGSGLSQFLNASADYRLGEINTLSFSTLVRRGVRDGEDLNTYAELDADRAATRRYHRRSLGESGEIGMDYRLSFDRVIEPREHELSVEIEYETEWEDETDRYLQQVLAAPGEPVDAPPEEEELVDERQSEQEFEAEVNYQRPLGEHVRLEAGYEGAYEREESRLYAEAFNPETGAFVPDTDRNNAFAYAEQFHSAYGVVGGELGDFGAQLGVRAERALTTFDLETTNEDFGNNYFSLFPSVHLSYQPAERHTVRIGYSKRVDRPNTWQLNPFGDYDDPTSRRVGNPYLTPEYTHAFELGYTYVNPLFTLSAAPYYRYTVDAITWNERLTDEGVTIRTFENFAQRRSAGFEFSGSLTLGEWLRSNASFNVYREITDGSNLDTGVGSMGSDAIGYSTYLSATATLRPGLDLQLSQFYRAPMEVPGGRVSGFTATDLALQQELLGDRASLSLHVNDLFGTMGYTSWRETERYYQESVSDWNARGVRLSLRYNFGQGEQEQDRGGRRR